jgi:hypothetical protein
MARHFAAIGAGLEPRPPETITEVPHFIQEAPIEAPPVAPLSSDAVTLSEIVAPTNGTYVERWVGPLKLVIHSITIDSRSQRVPVPLALGPNLLPVPLRLSSPVPGSLIIEAEPALTPDGRSRMGIYHNADDAPERRCSSVTVRANAQGLRFFVGHRRARLQPLRCDSSRGDGMKPIKVSLSETALAIVAPEPTSQFAVLHTTDTDNENTIYAACVSVL